MFLAPYSQEVFYYNYDLEKSYWLGLDYTHTTTSDSLTTVSYGSISLFGVLSVLLFKNIIKKRIITK